MLHSFNLSFDLPVWYVRCQPVQVHSGAPLLLGYMQSRNIVLPGKTAKTPDGSNVPVPDPIPILIRIDGGLSSWIKWKMQTKTANYKK